ncbi:MAG: hypothetical protein R3C45_00955 [Phycisphaerales bacterium]
MAPYGPGSEEHIVESESKKLWDYTPEELISRSIRTGSHCSAAPPGRVRAAPGLLA